MTANAATQMSTDKSDPAGAASPIGNKVSVKYLDAKYAPGMRTQTMDKALCKKEIADHPYAQKYPLKLKCTPAKIQSQI